MPHYKRQFENGEIYHITVRRTGNEILSGDEQDLLRIIYSIYEFNNASHVQIRQRRKERARFKEAVARFKAGGDITGLGQTYVILTEGRPMAEPLIIEKDKRVKLVEVLAFAIMPNHIHLLVRQLSDRGISKFMQKFGSGYANWFKEKYNQKGKGHFFTNRFNAVHIENDEQLKTVLVYIFTNPAALVEPGFKERGVANVEKSIKFLEEVYRWSSYWDCLGKKNFPSIIEKEKDFILEIMGGPEGCREAVNDWIKYKGELRKLLAKSFAKKLIDQLE